MCLLCTGQMRSLRLFYSDKECTRGQVVIASRESQYKILHFHNGGLDKLAEIFEDWSLFAKAKDKVSKRKVNTKTCPATVWCGCVRNSGFISVIKESVM